MTFALDACNEGNLDKLVNLHKKNHLYNYEEFEALLSIACKKGRIDIVKYLLSIRPYIDIYALTLYGTPIKEAIHKEDIDIIRL